MGGYNLGSLDPKLKDHMLVAVTEVITREEIDDFASALKEAAND
jgi:glycine dehydrogenase subunit 1